MVYRWLATRQLLSLAAASYRDPLPARYRSTLHIATWVGITKSRRRMKQRCNGESVVSFRHGTIENRTLNLRKIFTNCEFRKNITLYLHISPLFYNKHKSSEVNNLDKA